MVLFHLMRGIREVEGEWFGIGISRATRLKFGFMLITPKSITGTYFDTKLSRFGLAGSLMVAILDF